ncbi:ABC transporter permease [Mucilaginibacter daejeonensis]|uniref:ABC transporter permease n=1 Tax=Mucilaginibacter daejeonensis TaxID=398049 RepID=UPI001D1705EA|nr:ABC transporter permease [Mucilaginibacter daejeonensis]UEG52624.1 ABC transporter permease [Mucilaginibacter daejeonensis]
MNSSYSNLRATLAITKASLRSIFRSPSAVIFSLLFPLIFIVIFANLGGGAVSVDVGVDKNSDTINPIYQILKNYKVINLKTGLTDKALQTNLSKGSLDAVISIQKNNGMPTYVLNAKFSSASQEKGNMFRSMLKSLLYQFNNRAQANAPQVAELKETTITGREYKYIDFILPGQLGFSLLSIGVFGTAFVFLSLRQTLVIKRFFATPVKRYSIVCGEMIARVLFAMMGSVVIIGVGHYAFGFTLIHGVATVLSMLLLALIGLIIFMGFGFIISGLAKNDTSIPPLSNLVTLPQFLLSGTFFSNSAFPTWLRNVSNVLPLTHLNNAMRKVAFEGAAITEVGHELLILLIWGIVLYTIAIKTFKWE